jgi:uncharacterized protein YhfF
VRGHRRPDDHQPPHGAVARFPRDGFLVRNGLEGYLAVPMYGAAGRLVGYVCVLSRERLDAGGEEFTVLRIFAARAAAELERRRHEADLRAREAEVAASRARLLHAADEERRRIGRDLHDGAQQRLVVLGQCLDLALRSAGRSPEDVRAHDRAGTRAGDARRPRAARARARAAPGGLSAHGLASALRSLGLNSPVPLRIDALPEQRLPGPVEVTVYYLVAEALSNAVKHAGATEVRVALHRRGPVLHVQIADDGAGGAQPEPGSGLGGLADRIEALGAGSSWRARRAPGPCCAPRSRSRPGETGASRSSSSATTATGAAASAPSAGSSRAPGPSPCRWRGSGTSRAGRPRSARCSPITDHEGRRRALVEVTRVAVLPFGQIDEAVASAESAGTETLEEWLASHRAFYAGCRDEIAVLLGESGWRLTDAEPMVVTSFRLVERGPAPSADRPRSPARVRAPRRSSRR